jgi:hypothetical protein
MALIQNTVLMLYLLLSIVISAVPFITTNFLLGSASTMELFFYYEIPYISIRFMKSSQYDENREVIGSNSGRSTYALRGVIFLSLLQAIPVTVPASMKMAVFWVVAPCGLVEVY